MQGELFPIRKWTVYYHTLSASGHVVAMARVVEAGTLVEAIRIFEKDTDHGTVIDAIRRV